MRQNQSLMNKHLQIYQAEQGYDERFQNLPQLPPSQRSIETKQKQQLNPYRILNVPKNYDEKVLKKAYLKKALKAHPDRGGSEDEFQKISIAYTVLKRNYLKKKIRMITIK